MTHNVFERLREYFQGIADALAGERSASAIFPLAADVGTAREDLLLAFLADHLPKRCAVMKGGFIFDASGNESKQIDLIVTNDLTLQFRQFQGTDDRLGKSFNCIEGCYCAISVKSTLDKEGLFDSLHNLASIPSMPPLSVNPRLSNKEVLQDLPVCIIFGFSGIQHETLLDHLRDFYASTAVPVNRRPNLIIVNNSYMVIQTGPQGATTRNETIKVPPFTFWPMGWNMRYVGGFTLFHLIVEIQKASNFGSQVLMNFDKYIDQLPIE